MKFHFGFLKKRVVGVIVGSCLLAVTFQNCGKAGFDSALDEGLTSASVDPALEGQFGSRDALKVQNIPFAYDVVPDQIAYSSCFGPGLQSLPGHFTFRIGAYSTGGVKIKQSFFDYLKANFQPIAPATELSVNQIKSYLAYSPENIGAAPQIALRTKELPQMIRVPDKNGAGTVGIDFINVLSTLTNDRFMDPLINNRTTSSLYFPMATSPSQRYLEASIAYNTSEALADQVRKDAQRYGMLALTFAPSTPSVAYAARVPASATDSTAGTTDMTKVYGRGYYLNFVNDLAPYSAGIYKRTAPAISNPSNILQSVQEVNLENKTTAGSWTCAMERRYVIVRQEDAAISCPKETASNLANATYRRELEIVRRQLKAEDWDVNIALRCVVPKQGSCYPKEFNGSNLIPIQYDQGAECFQGLSDVAYTGGATPVNRCAQYVSICTRN